MNTSSNANSIRRRSNRSRSNSPASSVDSSFRRSSSSSSNKKKQPPKQLKSKEDVQVFTSLPPKVEGDIKCFLKLQITRVNLINESETSAKNAKTNNSSRARPQQASAKENSEPETAVKLIARCVWWGEDSTSAIFRPKQVGIEQNPKKLQTTAKYMVRSGPKQFSAYLNDMKTLDIELINELTMEVIGKVQLFEIGQLTSSNPIKGYFPAFNTSQAKIADVHIIIQFESLRDSLTNKTSKMNINASDQSLLSDHSRPTTPTPSSTANINEFYTKYQLFEQQQLRKDHLAQQKSLNDELKSKPILKTSSFNSNSYETCPFENVYANLNPNPTHQNPLINTLIEKGNKLKTEMLKSTCAELNATKADDSSLYSGYDDPAKTYDDYLFGLINALPPKRSNMENALDLDTNEFIEHYSLNEISRLSDPLHDTELLSALIYDNHKQNKEMSLNLSEFGSKYGDEDDQELKELLQPKNLFSRLAKKETEEPVQFSKSKQTKNATLRRRSMSRSSDEDAELDLKKTSSSTRVSFDLESSDAESCMLNSNSERCVDVLSPQRLSLLNLVQIAKLRVDKMCLFSLNNAVSIVERINKIEMGSTSSKQSANKNAQTDTTKMKPPKATKKTDPGQLFFIEYQFPVIASSRDDDDLALSLSNSQMATQIMRVPSKKLKKQDEDVVSYEHSADYSVLFNSRSLEAWWRSGIVFKIYCRSAASTSPYLIGVAKLNLRNVLKSRNFKLYKKLAIIDQLNELEETTSGNKGKRIGTLHAKIELTSDLKEFNVDLLKLKCYEEKNGRKPASETQKAPALSTALVKAQPEIIEEFSMPIQMFLSINEGKGFNSLISNDSLVNIYLICRLFWNKEKVKFETSVNSKQDSKFCWTLNLSFMIKPSLIENMRNNFMIIEAWKKGAGKDSLIGTIKLPLHEFYVNFRELSSFRRFLSESGSQPLIGVNGWVSAFDPFTGNKAGEINVLLAMGSSEQIINLQKLLFDTVRLRLDTNNDKIGLNSNAPAQPHKLIEHIFTFKVDNIKIHPVRTTANRSEVVLDETDYYVKYMFPSSVVRNNKRNSSLIDEIRTEFNSYSIAARTNSNFIDKQEHRLILSRATSLPAELSKQFKEFYKLDGLKLNGACDESCVLFEIWSRSYYPNQRDKLIARGELSTEKLITVANNASINVNNRSFIVPLVMASSNEQFFQEKNDKYVGQLFMTVEYSTELIDYTLNANIPTNESYLNVHNDFDDNSHVCLSIGVLRANNLQLAISSSICKNDMRAFNLESSSVYVKFSLNFLNRPQEFKQTRVVQTSLNGFSPEFFDYFDLKCPLVSTYNSSTKRTVSLAEQLELGQIIFELWSKCLDYQSNKQDILLGTCIVPLEPLLENRIGIRGWLSINKPANSSLLESILDDKSVGGLEIAIRFTKTNDYLRIIDVAKEIGWIRAEDFNSANTTKKPANMLTNFASNHEMESTKVPPLLQDTAGRPKPTIKCLIEIEKAVHLPTIYDEKLNRHSPPNAFVSFSISLDNPAETAQTSVIEKQLSPNWAYQLLLNVDSEYFVEDSKYFVFKVWHKFDSASSNRTSNKIIGYASVDLQPMLCGLSNISGWYNIQDSVGSCQGQLKINILPQENLFALKQIHLNRKKNQLSTTEKSLSSFNSRFESLSQASSSLNDLRHRSASPAPHSVSPVPTKLVSEPVHDLKSGLTQKLNELDELNRRLKERLETKTTRVFKTSKEASSSSSSSTLSTPVGAQKELVSNNLDEVDSKLKENSQGIFKINHDISDSKKFDFSKIETIEIHIIENEPKLAEKNEVNITKVTLDEDSVLKQSQSMNGNESTIDLILNHPKLLEQNESVVVDSFWASSVAIDGKLSEKSANEEANLNNSSHLPPIYSFDSNQDEKELNKHETEKKQVNLDVANDTDLDQTFNLNASYEIIPNKNGINESQVIDTYDFVDKIIDCTKLDDGDDNLVVNDGYEVNETSLIINNGDEDENEEEGEGEYENLTVVVPEEINKIAELKLDSEEVNEQRLEIIQEKNDIKTSDSEIQEKFKQINSKLPNYFLPEKDLEKSMKRLHYNYKDINVNDGANSNDDSSSQDVLKTKLKSTALLAKNEKLLTQDFSRINKIFHTKFN